MSSNEPWSCQDLVDHADNWSLAGNVGLLRHMEQFAENLFPQADETNNNLENLLKELDSTEIQLDLVKNQFLGLQNTQFIESRVYEDDETVPVATEVQPTTTGKVDDAKKKELLKNAVVDGLKVLDRYYEKVSIPESDSEGDETDFNNFVLRERDPYIHRPLPYVIGSQEWLTKWHAGLAESSDDDEDEENRPNGVGNVEDEFSDTDSETNLPVADRRSHISEQDNVNANNYAGNDNYYEVNGNSVSASTPIAAPTFAEQLATKLGDVISLPHNSVDPEVNTRPIQRKTNNVASALPDQPPDLTETYPGSTGLFSGGGGLFDDDDYDKPPPILPTHKSNTSKKSRNLFDEDENSDDDSPVQKPAKNHQKITKIVSEETVGKRKVGGLFDDDDDVEEDIFAQPPQFLHQKKKEGLVYMPTEPPRLESDNIRGKVEGGERKKPIGGVNVLGSFLPPRKESSSSRSDISEDDNFIPKINNKRIDNEGKVEENKEKEVRTYENSENLQKNEENVKKTSNNIEKPESKDFPGKNVQQKTEIVSNCAENETSSVKPKILSLFDNTDDLFDYDDDLFSPVNQPKPKKNLFDDKGEILPLKLDDADIFDGNASSFFVSQTEKTKTVETSSFVPKSNVNKSLFDDDDDDFERFDEPPPLFDANIKSDENKPKRKTRNLFDESSEEEDDMFANIVIPKSKIIKNHDKNLRNDYKNVTNENIKKVDDTISLTEDKIFKDEEIEGKNQIEDIKDEIEITLGKDKIDENLAFSNEESLKEEIVDELKENKIEVKKIEVLHEIEKPTPKLGLFDDPPPLNQDSNDDDDWTHVALPKIPQNQDKNDNNEVNSSQIQSPASTPEKRQLPGKLKLPVLNINVNALMPGARLPKVQSKDKEIEDDPQDGRREDDKIGKVENAKENEIVSESATVSVAITSDTESTLMTGGLPEKGDKVDVDILPSVTKSRAKIPIKRRPSTRQGRKAALKSSQSQQLQEEPLPEPPISSSTANPTSSSSSSISPLVSIPSLSTMIDPTDNIPTISPKSPPSNELIKKEVVKNENNIEHEETNVKPQETNLKMSLNEEPNPKPPQLTNKKDTDIFNETITSNTKHVSLFDDDDIDNDIFGSFSKVLPNQTLQQAESVSTPKKLIVEEDTDLFSENSKPTPVLNQPKQVKTKTLSLFGDDDDEEDDDLFASIKPPKASKTEKKSKNVSLFGDDDDDDDDIFNTKIAKKQQSTVNLNKSQQKSVNPKNVIPATAKNDPLADLFGDSD